MNRKIVLAVAAIFIFVSLYAMESRTVFAAESKIGYVDMAKVFSEYNKTKDAEKTLEDKGKAKEDERKKIVDEIRKLKDEQSLLSDKAKAEKQGVIDDKIKGLQDFDRKTRDELLKDRNDSLGNILKDIEKIVTDYAKETGYDMVLDSRMLLYSKEGYDLTAEVLKRLNK